MKGIITCKLFRIVHDTEKMLNECKLVSSNIIGGRRVAVVVIVSSWLIFEAQILEFELNYS